MSFQQNPSQASATGTTSSSNVASTDDDKDNIFKNRTFDVTWVDKSALMYKEGYAKTFDKETRKSSIQIKRKSSIPLILRDMAPPEGSIFDPAKKWEEEKKSQEDEMKQLTEAAAAAKIDKKSNKKSKPKKQSAADSIRDNNAASKLQKDHERDLQKLSNLRSLKALQESSCETESGKIHRMVKILHLAVSDLKEGSLNSSEAEVLDILWALEEMPTFTKSEKEIDIEKKAKKEEKKEEKAKSKDKKDSSKSKKNKKDKKEKIQLSAEAQTLKSLLKEGGDSRGAYKDSLKYARKLMASKENLISFQLTEMPDRLPPLSRYNRRFKLEKWQCDVLSSIDKNQSAVVCAPTSSGKTLLSTYTCKKTSGTVLFVLPSEVLVWQVAATYYEFFRGNVTICTDLITFQEISGDAQVYIGTPRALELSITKVRGCAGQEMVRAEKEFMVLDGGYSKFDYLVLDEVHTLNGPEGDALQRIIKACKCPCLALSATIGNALQLKNWFQEVTKQHMEVIESEEGKVDIPREVVLKEFSARFINLQRYVVTQSDTKNSKKIKLVKLHPVAAMTQERLKDRPELIASLAMTPMDMMDLWKKMRSIFPSTVLEDLDDPDHFFNNLDSKRITLDQTREYEIHLKKRLTVLSDTHPDLYERLRKAQLPPPISAAHDISDQLYGVIEQLKQNDLLPAVAFQLDTYGAFNMFKNLLARLESEQVAEFPNYRKDLIKLAREKAAMRKVAAGKSRSENAVDAEEDAKMGLTDDLLIQEDTTKPHDKYVLSAAGKRLSYGEVEDIMADMKKSGEKVDINHALIRGLRRGIAIYTNEVGFSCYRRQVQMLAQKGRIAVVFSDSALAFGVNMPFRTCVFCGDMGDKLTPLIAQQMQGRAGRRGMDVQGNVIYVGMDWAYIENLMLGQISQVVGKNPRYPIMTLQYALAASNDPDDMSHFIHESEEAEKNNKFAFASAIKKLHRTQTKCYPTVSENMMEWMCNTTLEEFCEEKTNDKYFEQSAKVIEEFGYVDSNMRLAKDHNVLSMIWEMHGFLPEAIHLAAVLDQLYLRFCFNKTKQFKESDATQNDFLATLCHVVDRHPPKDGEESLQQMLKVSSDVGKSTVNDDARSLWLETEQTLRKQKDLIDGLDIPQSEKDAMHLVIPPASADDDDGPALDKGVYEMLMSKQKGFREDQSDERRNELKDRIFVLGQICLIAHNNLQQPHGDYSALEVHFRRLFSNIKYSIADMMNQLTDQFDITEV